MIEPIAPIQPHQDAPSTADAMEGKARYSETMGRKVARVKRARQTSLALALTIVAVWAGLQWPGLPIVAALALAAVAFVFDRFRVRWSEAEYYALPATRMASGKHRCVHCGHNRVYLHYEGGSHEQLADCPQCNTRLWSRKKAPGAGKLATR